MHTHAYNAEIINLTSFVGRVTAVLTEGESHLQLLWEGSPLPIPIARHQPETMEVGRWQLVQGDFESMAL